MGKEREGRDTGEYQGGNLAKDGDRLYLGDVSAVSQILRDSASDVMFGGDAKLVASRVADIFLGKSDLEHIPVPGWNVLGGIDDVLGRWFGAGQTPEMTVSNAFMRFMEEVNKLAVYSTEPGVTSDLWKDQVDAIVGQYALCFVGVSPQTQNTVL